MAYGMFNFGPPIRSGPYTYRFNQYGTQYAQRLQQQQQPAPTPQYGQPQGLPQGYTTGADILRQWQNSNVPPSTSNLSPQPTKDGRAYMMVDGAGNVHKVIDAQTGTTLIDYGHVSGSGARPTASNFNNAFPNDPSRQIQPPAPADITSYSQSQQYQQQSNISPSGWDESMNAPSYQVYNQPSQAAPTYRMPAYQGAGRSTYSLPEGPAAPTSSATGQGQDTSASTTGQRQTPGYNIPTVTDTTPRESTNSDSGGGGDWMYAAPAVPVGNLANIGIPLEDQLAIHEVENKIKQFGGGYAYSPTKPGVVYTSQQGPYDTGGIPITTGYPGIAFSSGVVARSTGITGPSGGAIGGTSGPNSSLVSGEYRTPGQPTYAERMAATSGKSLDQMGYTYNQDAQRWFPAGQQAPAGRDQFVAQEPTIPGISAEQMQTLLTAMQPQTTVKQAAPAPMRAGMGGYFGAPGTKKAKVAAPTTTSPLDQGTRQVVSTSGGAFGAPGTFLNPRSRNTFLGG